MEFIFNNLSHLNLRQKCDEIRELMKDECMISMAQYLVMQRAIVEPNYHVLYSHLLDRLKEPMLYKIVIYETLKNIRILLRTEKTIEDSTDRTQLKNLGQWLGMITLGRNRPILHVDIDMKGLLVEAYSKGYHELLYVVPFVARVLENCGNSRVFRPPNPWTMAIMNVLGELHAEPNLKLNLQFEIEVLCKNLRINVINLKRTGYLRDSEKWHTLEHQLSFDYRQIEIDSSEQHQQYSNRSILEQVIGITKTRPIVTQLPQQPVEEIVSRFHYLDITSSSIAHISNLLTIKDDLLLFRMFPHLKYFVGPAIELAIRECSQAVVDRSISIALITSESIVRKDFALDPVEMRMLMAARYMVCSLTASMIMIACHNEVITSINKHLVQAFGGAPMALTPHQKQLAEETATIVATDNIELACVFMQKSAIERAIPEMDKRLLTELELRQIARLEGRCYYDPLAKYEAESIPGRLRLKTYGVTQQQMLLYENFARNIPGFVPLLGHEVQSIFALNPDQKASNPECVNPNVQTVCQQFQVRDVVNPPSFTAKSEYLLHEWISLYHSVHYIHNRDKTFEKFTHQMTIRGIFKTDYSINRFFEVCTQTCVDLCYQILAETYAAPDLVHRKCFYTLDAFVQLIVLLVKNSGKPVHTNSKIILLNKVLGIVTGALLQDHEIRKTNFHQFPYHRILILLFLELCALRPVADDFHFQLLAVYCRILHILSPSRAPGFCYAWLELIGHRTFIEIIMAVRTPQRCWKMYAQLLMDLFKFLAPFHQNNLFENPFILFYKGTLRILLLLLHDFPEFLCFHLDKFCDVIPSNCIQMRNVILSAYPRYLQVIDPFSPKLEIDFLQGILYAPVASTNRSTLIIPPDFKTTLEKYMDTSEPVSFLSELLYQLQTSDGPNSHYNVRLMNAVVLHVGVRAIRYIQLNRFTLDMSTFPHSPHRDIFQYLAHNLNTEGRYLFFNAIVNQLRYPSDRTYYYSCTLFHLFATARTQIIQEQISRILLERLIVNKPHPWGLLVTFMELMKNPTYKFWTLDFVHCAPKIEKLFELMADLCRMEKPTPNQEATEY